MVRARQPNEIYLYVRVQGDQDLLPGEANELNSRDPFTCRLSKATRARARSLYLLGYLLRAQVRAACGQARPVLARE